MFTLRAMMKFESLSTFSKVANMTTGPSALPHAGTPKIQQDQHLSFPDLNAANTTALFGGKSTLDHVAIPSIHAVKKDTNSSIANSGVVSKAQQSRFITSAFPLNAYTTTRSGATSMLSRTIPSLKVTIKRTESSMASCTAEYKMQKPRFVSSVFPHNAYTTTRYGGSSLLNRTIISGPKNVRTFSMKGDTPPAAKELEPSPITQACHKLPQHKLQVSSSTTVAALSQSKPLTGISQPTFLYHKLADDKVPSGWSNDPAKLEGALGIHVEDCGLEFKAAMPIMVALAQDGATVEWYLFETHGKYYFYQRKTVGLFFIMEPTRLEDILTKITSVGVGNIDMVLVGRVHGDDLECGSLMAAS